MRKSMSRPSRFSIKECAEKDSFAVVPLVLRASLDSGLLVDA